MARPETHPERVRPSQDGDKGWPDKDPPDVDRHLNVLTTKEGIVIRLHYLEEKTTLEISVQLKITRRAVQKRIKKALRKMAALGISGAS